MFFSHIFVLVLLSGLSRGDIVDDVSLGEMTDRIRQFALIKGLPQEQVDLAIQQVIKELQAKMLSKRLLGLLH